CRRRSRTRADARGSRRTRSRWGSRSRKGGFPPRQPRGLSYHLLHRETSDRSSAMSMRAKHKRRSGRALKVVLLSLGVLVILLSGTAYAAYRYDRSEAERILPGVTVAGVDLSGMTRDEAVRALEGKAETRLASTLVVQAAGEQW